MPAIFASARLPSTGLWAVGYAPPPNGGTTLEGDVIFNLNSFFQVAAGNAGDAIAQFQPPDFLFKNDFEGLLLHEVGHTLGMAHVPDGVQAVMSVDPTIYANINRQLDVDDINGIQFLYGIPEPSAWGLIIGAGGIFSVYARFRNRRTVLD